MLYFMVMFYHIWSCDCFSHLTHNPQEAFSYPLNLIYSQVNPCGIHSVRGTLGLHINGCYGSLVLGACSLSPGAGNTSLCVGAAEGRHMFCSVKGQIIEENQETLLKQTQMQ